MWNSLKHRFSGKPQSLLARRLADYPAFPVPFPGAPASITDEQAQANLGALLTQRERRLDVLGGLLGDFDLDFPAAFAEQSPTVVLDLLDKWALDEWADVPGASAVANFSRWQKSTREGPDIVYSMLMDVGIAMGETLIRCKPGLAWGIDLSIRNAAASDAFRRPVVRGLGVPDNPTAASDFDAEMHAFGAFQNVVRGTTPEVHGLTRMLRAMIERYPLLCTPD